MVSTAPTAMPAVRQENDYHIGPGLHMAGNRSTTAEYFIIHVRREHHVALVGRPPLERGFIEYLGDAQQALGTQIGAGAAAQRTQEKFGERFHGRCSQSSAKTSR